MRWTVVSIYLVLLQWFLYYVVITAGDDEVPPASALSPQEEGPDEINAMPKVCPSPEVENEEMPGEDGPLDVENEETTGGGDVEDCQDDDPECTEWASSSECDTNPTYMLQHCRLSCGTCHENINENEEDDAPYWKRSESSARMGVPQVLDTDGLEITQREVETAIQLALIYYDDYFSNHDDDGADDCRNRHELCAVWAALGDCSTNPDFLEVECAPLCHSCEESHAE